MEEIFLKRIALFINEIKTLTEQALNLCKTVNKENIETSQVIVAKLKSFLSRFTTELHNYFNICKQPDADEISDFTTHQLRGEEALVELEAKIRLKLEEVASEKETEKSYSKLPDLTLPEFSGNLLDWYQFWDRFTSIINRRKLNDVDKLLYLKSCLRGDAARLVDGFSTTNKSYQLAVKTLKERFGRDNEIIYAHHKALTNTKPAENISDSRTTYDEIERHLRILQSMGEDTNSNHIRYLIMEKFPSEIIYEIKMRLGSDGTESVQDIRKQLSIIISAKEESQRMTQIKNVSEVPQYSVETLHIGENTQQNDNELLRNDKPYNMKPRRNQFNNFKPGTNNWNLRTDDAPMKRKFEYKRENNGGFRGEKRKKWPCIFCGENHSNFLCEKFKTIEERKARLRNRCFNCLKEGHFTKECLSKKCCYECSTREAHIRHHRALCPNNFQKKTESRSISTSTRDDNN